jgi:hypothetical protein
VVFAKSEKEFKNHLKMSLEILKIKEKELLLPPFLFLAFGPIGLVFPLGPVASLPLNRWPKLKEPSFLPFLRAQRKWAGPAKQAAGLGAPLFPTLTY